MSLNIIAVSLFNDDKVSSKNEPFKKKEENSHPIGRLFLNEQKNNNKQKNSANRVGGMVLQNILILREKNTLVTKTCFLKARLF